jgi:hypothetical protein
MSILALRNWSAKLISGALGLAALAAPGTAIAQTPPPIDAVPPSPAQDHAVSDGGVDMRTGQYQYSKTDLQMGGVGGISLERTSGSEIRFAWKPMGHFSHNWHLYVTYKTISGGGASFAVQGSRGQQFVTGSNTNNFYTAATNHRTTLEAIPTGSGPLNRKLLYTTADGTKVTFREQTSISDQANRGQILAGTWPSFYAETIEEPDGTVYTLSYDAATSTNPAFLRRVTSSAGYVLIFEWVSNPVDDFISKACLFNAAVDTVPTSNSCSGASYSTTYSYATNGTMSTAVHPDTRSYGYNSTFSPTAWQTALNNAPNTQYTWTESYTHPGETTPYLTNTIFRDLFTQSTQSQDFALGPDYTYVWNVTEHNEQTMEVAGGTMTRSDGATKTIEYQEMMRAGANVGDSLIISEGPDRIVDALGREMTSDYCVTIVIAPQGPFPGGATGCAAVSAKYWEFPEGNKIEYSYDGYGSVLETRAKPKPGSSEPDLVTTYTYDCSSLLSCRKPNSITDPEGNVTNITYSSDHGGVLKRTLPADADGVRPETRYTYGQRYAWTKSGSSYVQASTPIWLLLSEEYCRTSAADVNGNCAAGSSDEVVTNYEYETGNASTGSNLLLLGTAVTADGTTLRSCMSYDKWGRAISETQPKAGLTSCL